MRIISKFHDYYDCIQSIGYDPSLTYVRAIPEVSETEIIEFKKRFFQPISTRYSYSSGFVRLPVSYISDDFSISTSLVGIAGVIYNGVSITDYKKETQITFYDYPSVMKFMDDTGIVIKERYPNSGFYRDLRNFLLTNNRKKDYTFFIEHNIPIFTYQNIPVRSGKYKISESDFLHLNGNLSDMEVYRLMDPYTVYQEIAMFLSGVLGVGNPKTVEIDDKSMLAKKGFDNMSFKKEKENG